MHDDATSSRLCGLAGLGLARARCARRRCRRAPSRRTSPTTGPYYVVFNASGGWDTTYLMDPKGINGINRLYKEGDILTQGAHKFAPTAKHIKGGMSNEDFYAEFGDELLVLNGLDYSVNNHSPGARYMATGKLDSLAYPTFAALVAACQGPACPLAFLTFGNYSATGNLVAMSRVPYLPSLQKHRQRRRGRGQRALALSRPTSPSTASSRRCEDADRGPRRRAAAAARRSAPRTCSTRPRSTRRRCSGSRRTSPRRSRRSGSSQQAEIALASFKAGVCVSANLTHRPVRQPRQQRPRPDEAHPRVPRRHRLPACAGPRN